MDMQALCFIVAAAAAAAVVVVVFVLFSHLNQQSHKDVLRKKFGHWTKRNFFIIFENLQICRHFRSPLDT